MVRYQTQINEKKGCAFIKQKNYQTIPFTNRVKFFACTKKTKFNLSIFRPAIKDRCNMVRSQFSRIRFWRVILLSRRLLPASLDTRNLTGRSSGGEIVQRSNFYQTDIGDKCDDNSEQVPHRFVMRWRWSPARVDRTSKLPCVPTDTPHLRAAMSCGCVWLVVTIADECKRSLMHYNHSIVGNARNFGFKHTFTISLLVPSCPTQRPPVPVAPCCQPLWLAGAAFAPVLA